MADNPQLQDDSPATLPDDLVAAMYQEATTGAYVPRGVTTFRTGGSAGAWTFTLAPSGAGAVDAGTPRVTLASDDPAVVALQILDNIVSGSEAQVDIVGALPTGSNVIGAVTQSGTWNVGTVTTVSAVTSITNTVTVTGAGGTFPVTDSGGSLTVDAPVGTPVFVRLSDGASAITTLAVSLASVPSHAVTNAGTFVVQVDGTALTRLTDIKTNTDSLAVVGNGAAATAVRVTLANDSTGIIATVGAVTSITNALPAGTNAIGKLAANSGVDIGDVDITSIAAGDNNIGNVDIVTMPNVTLAAGTNTNEVVGDAAEDAALAGNPVRTGIRASRAVPTSMSADGDVVTPWADREGRQVTKQQCGTGTTSAVADSATSVTVLAANTQRLGAVVVNDSDQILYLKAGATATTSDYTYKVLPGGTVEIPFGYSGVLDGIWAANSTGSARVTEFT
jgi:hypothetical protein